MDAIKHLFEDEGFTDEPQLSNSSKDALNSPVRYPSKKVVWNSRHV